MESQGFMQKIAFFQIIKGETHLPQKILVIK